MGGRGSRKCQQGLGLHLSIRDCNRVVRFLWQQLLYPARLLLVKQIGAKNWRRLKTFAGRKAQKMRKPTKPVMKLTWSAE